jgi:hypothetical protein
MVKRGVTVGSYKLIDRAYKARKGSPAGRILIEVDTGAIGKTGLAVCLVDGKPEWREAGEHYCGGWGKEHLRWEISSLWLGFAYKQHLDWSLRGWLDRYMRYYGQIALTDLELDNLARQLEVKAGMPDSGPHERYHNPSTWVNSCGVVYPCGMWWRPVKVEVEVNGC